MNSALIGGRRVAYDTAGPQEATTVVLIHCLGSASRMWQTQVAALSRRLRVVVYDICGHGDSDHDDNPVSIATMGADLLALLDFLKIARAHVCGLSLGGMIAQWAVIHHPQRVERAVFANTAARLGTTASWEARIDAVRAGGMAGVREAVLARFFSAAFRAQHPETTKAFGDILQATRAAGFMAACAALRDADLRPLVSSIQVPSLVIAGELDEATPPAQSAELHAAVAGSEFILLKDVAHLSNVEQPEAFNRCLVEFFGAKP